MSQRPRIVVAMSGGVDSSTAAAVLCAGGAEVIGVTLKLYDARGTSASIGGRCCGPRDIEDARVTAATLGIPHYVLDHTSEFSQHVVDDFVAGYREGRTPNPCVKCNQHLKFGPLVAFARAVGAEALATGHYARLVPAPGGDGPPRLLRAIDRDKDQAYFLFAVRPELFSFVRFPLGAMTKPEVREAARRLALPNCDKPDSQQLCFIPDGDHKRFIEARGGAGRSGAIVDEAGAVVGAHEGTHNFTVGQRKGLPADGGGPRRFVLRIAPDTGTVFIGPRDRLGRSGLRVGNLHWLRRPPAAPFRAEVQIRHHSAAHAATVSAGGTGAGVHVDVAFDQPVDAVAPGQAAVIYVDDEVVGGGWIEDEAPVARGPAASAALISG